MMEEKLKLFRIDEKKLREQLGNNLKEQRHLRQAIWVRDNQMDIGDDVNIGGKKGQISKLDAKYSSVQPIVTLYKKDGTLGKRETRVWSSDKMKKL